ncbi:MAG: hypothetical protein K1X53_03885 [Candidatus Sumerlaeaceae bacterium]|nr:hypothetical protein [Candidatus Sumerlaeaceae bacterium]
MTMLSEGSKLRFVVFGTLLAIGVLGSLASAATPATGAEKRTPIGQPPGNSFPIILTQPGQYYLTGNLTSVGPNSGVFVTTSGVKLDLNGYSIIGTGGSNTIGVSCPFPTAKNLEVCNGRVTNCGVGVEMFVCSNVRVHHMNCSGNRNSGIAAGDGCLIEECMVNDMSAPSGSLTGIRGGKNANIRNCVVSNINTAAPSNSGEGILCGSGARIHNCTVAGVTYTGTNGQVEGIVTGDQSLIEGCISRDNKLLGSGSNPCHGIAAGNDSHVINCVSSNNQNSTGGAGTCLGIKVDSNCLVTGNNVTSNTIIGTGISAGIRVNKNTRVERNSVAGHGGSSANKNYGILAGFTDSTGNVIVKNSTMNNTGAGIRCDNTSGSNYHAENVQKETTPFSQAAVLNVAGTGDRADVAF